MGLSKICSPKGNCWRNHGLHFLIYCLGQMGLLVGRGAGTTNCNKGMDIMIKIPEIIWKIVLYNAWLRSRQQKRYNFFCLSERKFKHENKPRGWRDSAQILDCSLEKHTYMTKCVFMNRYLSLAKQESLLFIKFQNQKSRYKQHHFGSASSRQASAGRFLF